MLLYYYQNYAHARARVSVAISRCVWTDKITIFFVAVYSLVWYILNIHPDIYPAPFTDTEVNNC